MVSEAALAAGGYVHGIMPSAMLASTRSPERDTRSAEIDNSGSSSSSNEQQNESMRGAGTLVVHDDVIERLTMEIVGSMHEVRHAKRQATIHDRGVWGLINASEEAQNGAAGHGRIYRASRRIRDF